MKIKLRDYQTTTIERLIENYNNNIKRNLVVLSTGLGKCHPKGTQLIMYDGTLKDVSKLKVGDKLMGPDSKPRTIQTLGTGLEQCYKIIPTKGEIWECNESHILSLVGNRGKDKNKIINISVKDYFKQTETFKHTHKLYHSELIEFQKNEIPIDPYFLGVWLGDGTSTLSTCSFTNIDIEIEKYLKKFTKENDLELHILNHPNRTRTINICDKKANWKTPNKITEKLRKLNLHNNKHIPEIYKVSSKENRFNLLAGLLDTDGNLHCDKIGFEITQKSETLADDIAFIARSLGLTVIKKEKKVKLKSWNTPRIYYRLSIIGDTHLIPTKIKRKQAKARKQIKNYLRSGFKIEPVGIKEYYGFTLNGDHLYLLKDFTVTHNTFIATMFHQQFHPEWKTLFIVDRIELAYQARDSFLKTDPKLRVGIEMADHHASKRDEVIIISIDSIGKLGSKRIGKFNSTDFKKVFVDEAHVSVSPMYLRVLNYLGVGPTNYEDEKILIGLTATPNRTDNVSLGYVFDEIIGNYDLSYGIKNGWLTDLDIINIDGNIDTLDIETDSSLDKINELLLKAYLKYSPYELAIGYAMSVDHAYMLADIFNTHGIESACIEANTDKKERQRYVDDYKKGKIKVLWNYQALAVGFDAPETSTIILGRPIKAELLLRQIIGRGIRPSSSAFIDFFETPEKRLKAIALSEKPTCKVIDICDVLGEQTRFTPASLFGVHPKIKTKTKSGFYKEVVEPLEDLKEREHIDVSMIENLDNLQAVVRRQKLKLEKLETPLNIQEHSELNWVTGYNEFYEVAIPKENKHIQVKKNQLDKFEVLISDDKKKHAHSLNSFYDLSAAIKLADEYAKQNYDLTYAVKEEWMNEGVSKKQRNFLKHLLKGGIKIDWKHKYSNGEPHVIYRNTGELLNSGTAHKLIQDRLKK